jgi:predicted nucleotidyltransferase
MIDVRALLAELKAGLRTLYGERLKGLYLFGSYARGEADEDSDVDVLIVLDRVDRYAEELDRTSELVSRVSVEYGVSVSRVFASERQWREAQTMFFLNVREDAVPA